MITNPEQLPHLPEWCLDDDRALYVLEGMSGPQYRNDMQAYARACVSSATEALRAEVAELNHARRLAFEAGRAQASRAERLAEALREIAEWKLPETGETWPSGGPVSYEAAVGSRGVQDYIRSKASATLEQEAGRVTKK